MIHRTVWQYYSSILNHVRVFKDVAKIFVINVFLFHFFLRKIKDILKKHLFQYPWIFFIHIHGYPWISNVIGGLLFGWQNED